MKKNKNYILIFSLFLVLGYGCSLKKNTWQTRTYKEISTRFNVFFNGELSYREGLENIAKANQEDFTNIIPMYPVSHHTNAQAGKSNMERTIEKCRKAIKLYSIKTKPKKNFRKAKNPEYILWYTQEEFNPALKNAWILLGKAEFHKADFIGAVGTFTYIMHHYENDKDMVAQCQLWIVRAYAEMDWIYEAEQVLSKVKQENLSWKNVNLFASVSADLLLKKQQYKDAIPFLELALKNEQDRTNRLRFTYLLGQLYQKTGDNKASLDAFQSLLKMNPAFEMAMNTEINIAALDPNVNKVRKSLQSMLKNAKNKDYFDKINYAIGNTYLLKKDTAKAIIYYNKSVDSSVRNGLDKGISYLTLGDIYYNQKKYILAQPCYDQASKLFPSDYAGYDIISKRTETLGELVSQFEIVHLQDSLQVLARLPEEKRNEAIQKVIQKVIADEKAATEAANKSNNNNTPGEPGEEFIGNPIGFNQNTMGNWYFYNTDLIRSGKTEFQKKWGNRKLEDNWRRTSKASSMFSEENNNGQNIPAGIATDTAKINSPSTPVIVVTDNKKPEFYLQQIPLTPAQFQKSNDDLAEALFNMGMIFKDKINDYNLAVKSFEDYLRRFPQKIMASEACFQLYLINVRMGNPANAEIFRQKLIKDYPNSKYMKILINPDFVQQQQKMYIEQDSLYNQSYKAFNSNNFDLVKKNADYIFKTYPSSALLPKFLFLKTLSIGKSQSKTEFETALNDLINKYPDNEVSSMSKDILALLKQGFVNKTGTSQGSLLAKRDQKIDNSDSVQFKQLNFSSDKLTKHRVLFVVNSGEKNANDVLYNIAVYNFTRIIMKDYDLVTTNIDTLRTTVSVVGFDSFDDALWYLKSVQNDTAVNNLINKYNVISTVISEENYGLLKISFGLDNYLTFYRKLEQNSSKNAGSVTSSAIDEKSGGTKILNKQ